MIYTLSHEKDTLYRLKRYKEVYKPKGTSVFLNLQEALKAKTTETAIFTLIASLEDLKECQDGSYLLIQEVPIEKQVF